MRKKESDKIKKREGVKKESEERECVRRIYRWSEVKTEETGEVMALVGRERRNNNTTSPPVRPGDSKRS